jgi:hypothetical protein
VRATSNVLFLLLFCFNDSFEWCSIKIAKSIFLSHATLADARKWNSIKTTCKRQKRSYSDRFAMLLMNIKRAYLMCRSNGEMKEHRRCKREKTLNIFWMNHRARKKNKVWQQMQLKLVADSFCVILCFTKSEHHLTHS